MHKPTTAIRTTWLVAGVVACLLWPASLCAGAVCEHCARMDRPSSSDGMHCREEGGCPSGGQMAQGVLDASSLAAPTSFSPSVLDGDAGSIGGQARAVLAGPALADLLDPRWDPSPPLFLLVASFLL